jgi:hypothetical protein
MSLPASVHRRCRGVALVLMTVVLAACSDPPGPSGAVNEGDVLSEGGGSCALNGAVRGGPLPRRHRRDLPGLIAQPMG